jgi:hypothetical protein
LLVQLAFYLLVIIVVFGGTMALALWAMRVHDRSYPRNRVKLGEGRRRFGFETRFTWLSGGRG